jgi:PAS domain S-box-containing protein
MNSQPPSSEFSGDKNGFTPGEFHSNLAFKELLGSIYDGVAICDLDGIIIDANERLLSFVGYAKSELITRSIRDLLSGANKDLMTDIKSAMSQNRHVLINAYAQRKNGSLFPVEISTNELQLDNSCLCFFFRDITVRRQSEDLLRTGYNAISNCLSGIMVADPMGVIVYTNPSAAKLWGCVDEAALKGRRVLDLWDDPTMAQHMMNMIMDSDQEWSGDLVAKRMDGGKVALHVAAACNLDSDNEATGMVFSFIDITDRLRADAAVRDAQAREAMLASLAAACHHLGQPATVLLTSLGMLKEQNLKADEESVMLYKTAHEAAMKLTDILRKLGKTNEYRTTNYLLNRDANAPHNKMLDIE